MSHESSAAGAADGAGDADGAGAAAGADGADDAWASIAAVGAYAPSLRVSAEEFVAAWGRFEASGIERKAVPDGDEDALTMAAAAGRRALDAAGGDGDRALEGSAVDYLAFVSTTPPIAEEELTPRFASMLGISEDATLRTYTGSTRVGLQALVSAPADATSLVVASDCPRGEPDSSEEHAAGAGAAAFLCRPDGAARIAGHAEHATPYPGTRFRRTGDDRLDGIDVTSYDRQAFTEVLGRAAAGVDSEGVTAAAVQSPDGKLPYRATDALGVDASTIAECATVADLGDTGAASVPLGLARALADGHEAVLAAAWGSGAGADVARIETDGAVPCSLALDGGEELTYAEYLRRRGEITSPGLDTGAAYVSVPSWRRSLPQRHRLVAGECPACGALAFPPEGACSGCGDLVEYDPVAVWGEGRVEAATTIGRGGAPPEFADQQAKSGAFGVAIVELERDGETVSLPAQVLGEVSVDDRVVPQIRRIYTQEDVTRYGAKFLPVD